MPGPEVAQFRIARLLTFEIGPAASFWTARLGDRWQWTRLNRGSALYGHVPVQGGADPTGNSFCYVSPFITTDLNFTARVHDDFTFFFNVKNLFDAHAPVAPAAYASAPNFLTTWHYAGLIGRQFRAGATFKF